MRRIFEVRWEGPIEVKSKTITTNIEGHEVEVYSILPIEAAWKMKEDGRIVYKNKVKSEVIKFAREYCRSIEKLGGLAMLRVCKKTGKRGYQYENTYGRDPKKSKG